jgi:hypothetical protein
MAQVVEFLLHKLKALSSNLLLPNIYLESKKNFNENCFSLKIHF